MNTTMTILPSRVALAALLLRFLAPGPAASAAASAFVPPHSQFVTFSPDGRAVVTVPASLRSTQTKFLLWDVKTRKVMHAIALPHPNEANITDAEAVVFSPDSRLLAISTSQHHGAQVELYDVMTGSRIRALPVDWTENGKRAHRFGTISTITFSRDGRTLAVATYQSPIYDHNTERVSLWDVATARMTQVLGRRDCGCFYPEFSPDGKTLITIDGDYTVTLREARTGRRRSSFRLHAMAAAGYSPVLNDLSPDGRLLLFGGDRVGVYTMRGHRLWERGGRTNEGFQAVFSPGGRLVAYTHSFVSGDPQAHPFIRMCHARTGRTVRTIFLYRNADDIGFSPDGTLLTAVEWNAMHTWRMPAR